MDTYYSLLAVAMVLIVFALIILVVSGKSHTPDPKVGQGPPTPSGRSGAMVSSKRIQVGRRLDIPLVLTAEGRVVVRLVGEDEEDEDDLDDCSSSTFALDTAYDVNAVSRECGFVGKGEETTIITSQPTKMAVVHLPKRFRMGKARVGLGSGWLSGSSLVDHLEADEGAREAVVMPPGSMPRSMGGILGRTFLESPAFGSVTFGVGTSSFRTGVPLSALQREARMVAECDSQRDPIFGLFVLSNVNIWGRPHRFIVDTGAQHIILERNLSAKVAGQLRGSTRSYPLSMSGSSVQAHITTKAQQCVLGRSLKKEAHVVLVGGSVASPSVLNRTDGVEGLLGTQALRGLLIDIRQGRMTLWSS